VDRGRAVLLAVCIRAVIMKFIVVQEMVQVHAIVLVLCTPTLKKKRFKRKTVVTRRTIQPSRLYSKYIRKTYDPQKNCTKQRNVVV